MTFTNSTKKKPNNILNKAKRIQLVEDCNKGMSTQEAATKYNVSVRTVQRIKNAPATQDYVSKEVNEFTPQENAMLKSYYGFGNTEMNVCNAYGIDPIAFENLLKRCPKAKFQHLVTEQKKMIQQKFTQGQYKDFLAEKYRTTVEVINMVVKGR